MGRIKECWFSLEEELKECSVCKKRLPFECFHVNNRAKSGRFAQCKDCYRIKGGHVKKKYIFLDEEKKLKQCDMCDQILSYDSFSKNGNCRGGIMGICKECRRVKRSAKKRIAIVDPENEKKQCSKCKRFLSFNNFTVNSNMKHGIHSSCKECLAAMRQTYEYKRYINNYTKSRLKTDINFRLKFRIRGRIRDALRGCRKPESVTKSLGCSIEELKVYLASMFYERNTGEVMTFRNYGYRGWHLDHVFPLASFDLTNKEEFLKAAHYTNLQPLWAEDNYAKGSKI